MPIYDFKCTECGHQDEMMRKISDASTMDCPSCHKATFSKMLSAPSFQLNGTGWYATDFKNNNKAPSPAVTKQETENKTESKAEAPSAASCNPGCACH
jgi:putative FmdB family regulatory protein